MKKALQAKLKNKSGFTLIELLIVVAIIAILIAVSIPLIASAMDKAKISTDAANERGAKAEMVISATDDGINAGEIYAYDAAAGQLISLTAKPAEVQKIAGYGQFGGTGTDVTNVKDKILYVVQDGQGTVYYYWGQANDNTASESSLKSQNWTKGAGPLMQKADGAGDAGKPIEAKPWDGWNPPAGDNSGSGNDPLNPPSN